MFIINVAARAGAQGSEISRTSKTNACVVGKTSFDSCANKLPTSTFFGSFASHLFKLDLSATCISTYFSHSAVGSSE